MYSGRNFLGWFTNTMQQRIENVIKSTSTLFEIGLFPWCSIDYRYIFNDSLAKMLIIKRADISQFLKYFYIYAFNTWALPRVNS